MQTNTQDEVSSTLQRFQDGYTARDVTKLDEFMQLFVLKAIFDRTDLTADQKLMETTHYGIRRMYERSKGLGHSWPFTFTAVFMKIGDAWRFHTIHWSMPVE